VPAAPKARRPVVLTVDDNRLVHDFYALAFQHHYHHVRAYCGEEALKIVRAETIDVVVLDLILPGIPGLRVLERALKMRPKLIVVISSVIDSSQSALRAIRRGAADYFVKPTDPEVMEMVIRHLLATLDDPGIMIPRPEPVVHRVLLIGLDPGLRAALATALQPRCRVHVAVRISEAVELLGTIMPDLAIVDLRSASLDRVLGLECLRAAYPEGSMIIVGAVNQIRPFLKSSLDYREIIVPEPLNVSSLFAEIASLLSLDPDWAPMKPLGPASSAAVSRVLAQYADPTLRVEHLSAEAGLSAAHFSHIFSEEMGIPPMDYVHRVRTQAAIFMLRETRDKVSTIAQQVGFYDGPHLALSLRRRGLGRPRDFRQT